uniref:Transposase (Putative), gypsy type n=1 Tax=Tanacetum cinerariifolium TaxID=118510 RepID=A0A6L2JWP3_TANCI|nr:hypothetical protein [Tanacetum cinerariifolium]
MDPFAFIHASDPTKVRVFERERDEGEPRLLKTTVGRTVLLLPITPDRAESELEATVDKLFNGGCIGHQTEQGDSAGGGQDANIQPIFEVVDTFIDDVAPVQSRRQGKRKFVVMDVGRASHPPKKLPILLKVVTSVSTTTEHEDGDHTDSVPEPSLHTIGALSSAPIMTTVTITTPTVDPTSVTKEKVVEPSLFGVGYSFAGGTDPITCVFSDLTGSDFLVGRVYHEMVDEFASSKFFASIRGMEHDQLFFDFNVGAARQMSLSAEVRMRVEYNVKEKRRLKSVVESQGKLLKAREEEIGSLKARLLLKEVEAAEAIRLRTEALNYEIVEKFLRGEVNALRERNIILEKERDDLDVKVTELATSTMSKERQLTDLNALVTFIKSQNDSLMGQVHELEISSFGLQEKVMVYENYMEQLEKGAVLPHLLTTISGRMWLLTHGIELAIAKCLNSPEYLSALGTAIKKGMQYRLAAGITHGKEGRVLTDVAAHNPSAEADYISALQQLQNVNFPLFAELESDKDASQPNVDRLMLPIHSSSDKVVIGATALLLAFDASTLTCVEGTSGTVPATATTTALSTTLALTSTVNPIFIDDYEFVDVDDQVVASEDDDSFPNVDDAELHIP